MGPGNEEFEGGQKKWGYIARGLRDRGTIYQT